MYENTTFHTCKKSGIVQQSFPQANCYLMLQSVSSRKKVFQERNLAKKPSPDRRRLKFNDLNKRPSKREVEEKLFCFLAYRGQVLETLHYCAIQCIYNIFLFIYYL